jgi:uncharacterized protein YdaT
VRESKKKTNEIIDKLREIDTQIENHDLYGTNSKKGKQWLALSPIIKMYEHKIKTIEAFDLSQMELKKIIDSYEDTIGKAIQSIEQYDGANNLVAEMKEIRYRWKYLDTVLKELSFETKNKVTEEDLSELDQLIEILQKYISDYKNEKEEEIKQIWNENNEISKEIYREVAKQEKTKATFDTILDLESQIEPFKSLLSSNKLELKGISDSLKDKKKFLKPLNVSTFSYRGVNFTIRMNDLTLELTEAIVNPANSKLAHEGGAAKAIAQAAGKEFEEDCRTYISHSGQLRKFNVLKLMISK